MTDKVKIKEENKAVYDKAWEGFAGEDWKESVDVRDFIQKNYTPYEGDDSFLIKEPSANTKKLMEKLADLFKEEREKGILDVDTAVGTSITSHAPGYIEKSIEKIVGLQTDKPLKRALFPFGGWRVVEKSLEAYGYKADAEFSEVFKKYRKTHNDGVFDVYPSDVKKARHTGIITGLPDAYGRGRIIGDYRRIALYGTDFLRLDKFSQYGSSDKKEMTEEVIREREEIAEQYRALAELAEMAASYGFDITKPATNAIEATQWTYFAYLAAVKEQNGAAMSIGRISTFLDIYFERDMKAGKLSEAEAQELIDHLVMKLRIVRFLRAPEYNELFSGDPTWVTEAIGGMGEDGRSMVTKNSYRFLNTLYTEGPAPEPNLTVLWSTKLPENFKKFCAKVSIETSSIQYENDDIMREHWGDDYGIACCVSAMRIGKQMQFFGARANLAKALLYTINGGVDEVKGEQVVAGFEPVTDEYLDYETFMPKFDKMMDWLARTYMDALNCIHYMHDKYCYERIEMALHDKDILRTMACGIAGLSVAADSLSAIKYGKVKIKRDERGIAVDFETEGDFPKFGNNDERVDSIARDLVMRFMDKLTKLKTYRNAKPTQSILTITSNVVYGLKTGTTPDGRKVGEPFAPGANPQHGRDSSGVVASMMSLAQLPYEYSLDGISYTCTIFPSTIGNNSEERVTNLNKLLDGYFAAHAHHINVNILDRDMLIDAMAHPEKYPALTIRVSGYAVNFIKLTHEQQVDVITRTFHGAAPMSREEAMKLGAACSCDGGCA